jgi:ABC-2 type transport system ATP-binding protein
MTSLDRAKELISLFDLDPRGELKRMSKGMKQKVALVTAFMHEPELIILDEPTSGLDPLMQTRFIELIKDERKKGRTIFMSSHMFEEVEKTCDRVAIIKQGKIVTEVKMKSIEHRAEKRFEIKFSNGKDTKDFSQQNFSFDEVNLEKTRVKVRVHDKEINQLIQSLSTRNVVYISEIKYNLEQYFMHYYQKEDSIDV